MLCPVYLRLFWGIAPHLHLCSYPLGVGSFFVTLHTDGMELDYALCKRDEVQDVSKWLQECKGQQNSSQLHLMDRGIITLQRQNRHSVQWWAHCTVLLIVQSLKMCLVLHILLCLQWCSICPCSMLSDCLPVSHQHKETKHNHLSLEGSIQGSYNDCLP